jgi:hypothetical protein
MFIMKLLFLAHRTSYTATKGATIRALHSVFQLVASRDRTRSAERFWISSKG